MDQQLYIPRKLPGIVDMIWEHKSDTPDKRRLLPLGTVELLFRIGPPSTLKKSKKITSANNPLGQFCFLSGLQTRPIDLAFERVHMIGIKMQPIAVFALFGIPASEAKDFYIDGDAVVKRLETIEDKLNSDITFHEKAVWLENELLSNITETPELHTAIRLNKFTKKITVPTIETDIRPFTGYSRTQIYRLFNTWFGLSTNYYNRLLQFAKALKSMHQSKNKLTEIGFENGYFDQSHFIRSFKEFADITPGYYHKNMTNIPGQLSFQ